MSEYSESYHLKSNKIESGIELLLRAGLQGFVLPAANGWVTVLPKGDEFIPNESLIANNIGTLLSYLYGEDHAWWFTIYMNSESVASYACSWEGSIEVHKELDIAALENVIGPVLSLLGTERVRQILEPQDIEELFDINPPYAFAEAVGLTNYQWLSYGYLIRSKERGEPLPDGTVFVNDDT
jgi:hypothetical protein